MSDDSGIASHGARGERVLGPSAYRFGSVQSRVPTGGWRTYAAAFVMRAMAWECRRRHADSRLLSCSGPGTKAEVRTEPAGLETSFALVGGKCLTMQFGPGTDHTVSRVVNGSRTRDLQPCKPRAIYGGSGRVAVLSSTLGGKEAAEPMA